MANIEYTNNITFVGDSYLDLNMMPVESFSDLPTVESRKNLFLGKEIVVLNDGGQTNKYRFEGDSLENGKWVKVDYNPLIIGDDLE